MMCSAHDFWICCQLGAREHYAVPRALAKAGRLNLFITDTWFRPYSPIAAVKKSLRERFHNELEPGSAIRAHNMAALGFEAFARLRRLNGWELMIERNRWFQQRAIVDLSDFARASLGKPLILFAYSYAARDLLEFAHAQGWRTVLGQIDPGPMEQRIVTRLHNQNPAKRSKWQPPPSAYWDNWRIECDIADSIVVNSTWSRDALICEGVSEDKIHIVPLAYESTTEAIRFQRKYPKVFSQERPMRVLFLGQINLRKGIVPLLEAVNILEPENIEFWFVGPIQIKIPAEIKQAKNVRWFGSVPHGEAHKYYCNADVFIFPTLSDGFGLTQLEAQAWKLPVIASHFCGDVVRDGSNGVLLNEVTGEAIAKVLLDFMQYPQKLIALADQSGVDGRFSLSSLATALLSL